MIKKMINNQTEEKRFGDGRYVLNLPRKELYNFLKEQLPKDCVYETFEEFLNNLQIEEYEDDCLEEVGLTYTKKDDNGSCSISMVDDFIYISVEGYKFCKLKKDEDKLLLSYRRFVAKCFPEVKEIYIKSIAEKESHYKKFYEEECKKAYAIYKANMDDAYKHYEEIFNEECPILKI